MEMNNKILAGILIVAVVALGIYLFTGAGFGVGQGATVSAQGNSVIESKPDKVSVFIQAESRNKTAEETKARLDEIVDDLEISLLRLGLEREDIQMQSYNIYPDYEYDYSTGKRTEKGFVAQQSIEVKTLDFNKVAGIVDASVDSGALISWINFELSDEKQSELKAQALKEAGEDAKKKAEATASGLDKKLGKLISVKGEEFNYGPYQYFAASGGDVAVGAAEAKQAALNLAPSDVEVTATVTVEYALK